MELFVLVAGSDGTYMARCPGRVDHVRWGRGVVVVTVRIEIRVRIGHRQRGRRVVDRISMNHPTVLVAQSHAGSDQLR